MSTDGCPECTAQWNAVAVASVAFQAAVISASMHGLDTEDLITASGFDLPVIGDILAGGDL